MSGLHHKHATGMFAHEGMALQELDGQIDTFLEVVASCDDLGRLLTDVIAIVLHTNLIPRVPTPKRMLGDRGEAIAAAWYRSRGYEIVGAQVQVGRNEIDLICRDEEEIVFIEVKSAECDQFGDPLYKVDRYKRRAIVGAAERWLLWNPQGERGIRFDVVSVDVSVTPPVVDHRAAAFTADDI